MDGIHYEIIEPEVPSSSTTAIPIEPTFEQRIKDYFSVHKKTRIYILTPCYGGMCYTNFTNTLNETSLLFAQLGIELKIEFCKGDSLVHRARSNLITRAISDPLMTHCMFIDADITWNSADILKLVMADKEIVGGAYPIKHYNFNLLVKDGKPTDFLEKIFEKKRNSPYKEINAISDELYLRAHLVKYNINHVRPEIEIVNNLIEVRHLATGFMMIKRECIEEMQRRYPDTKFDCDINFLKKEENVNSFALFDTGVYENHFLSEDWLFCERWKLIGGKIFMDVTINLVHSGTEDFYGNFLCNFL